MVAVNGDAVLVKEKVDAYVGLGLRSGCDEPTSPIKVMPNGP